jgi:3-dehydroquinate synthase
MTNIQVTIPAVSEESYRIEIGSGIIGKAWTELESLFPEKAKFVVTDSNLVQAGHFTALIGKKKVEHFVIDPPGEVSKNIRTVTEIIESMEAAKFGRDSLIVALGGGIVGDIAGFCAAIFKRGISVVQIPTTTVAQADSSVGGKTGVDSTVSKNAFGSFWHPASVYIDTETLQTLPKEQYNAGLVESVKHALIADSQYFDFLEENIEAILNRDDKVLQEIAYKNCRIKADVVAEDPTEKNKRRVLNYGHTVGHAVETASSFDLLHGQAIAIGIIAAGLIEEKLGLAGDGRDQKIRKLLQKLDMPLKVPPTIGKKDLIDIIKYDKKAVDKWPKFVLLKEIGTALCKSGQWAHEVSKPIVEDVLDNLY